MPSTNAALEVFGAHVNKDLVLSTSVIAIGAAGIGDEFHIHDYD